MLTVRHFEAGDLNKLRVQDRQLSTMDSVDSVQQHSIAAQEYAYTALYNGEVIACFGIAEYWQNRGLGWTYLSKHAKPHMIQLTRICKRTMELSGIKRIEAAVEYDFEQGHRWMALLGMEKEADLMRAFSPDGRDCSLYARVA